MARKSKRMALNEAIRQGQAKIAEDLKRGQAKSDVPAGSNAERGEKGFLGPKKNKRSPVDKCREFLKSKDRFMFWRGFTPKMKWAASLLAASIAVLILIVWLAFLVTSGQPEQSKSQQTQVAGTVRDENKTEESGLLAGSSNRQSPEEGSLLGFSGGDNIICIQSIAYTRKDELGSLIEFFQRKGIATEVLAIDGPSGRLAVLVTRDGFEQNPVRQGADGYELAQRIKQLGPVYVEETKDTKFGVRPFQDIYGLKR